jgi:hypothetical protein
MCFGKCSSRAAPWLIAGNSETIDGVLTFASDHDIQLLITVGKEYGLLRAMSHKSLSKKLIFRGVYCIKQFY